MFERIQISKCKVLVPINVSPLWLKGLSATNSIDTTSFKVININLDYEFILDNLINTIKRVDNIYFSYVERVVNSFTRSKQFIRYKNEKKE